MTRPTGAELQHFPRRGFGDAFTGNFRYVDFPQACTNKLLISLMHDPAGAFHPNVEGIVLAGHTHCGQISIPFLGPIYTPSSAPNDAQCGLFQDEKRVLFVSAGATQYRPSLVTSVFQP